MTDRRDIPEWSTYSVEEAARRIGRDRRSLDRWIAANLDSTGRRSHFDVGGVRVPVVRIGRKWAVVARSLDAQLSVPPEAPSDVPAPLAPAPPASPAARCDECSAGQHHGCVVWGSACGCGRSLDQVWSDIDTWARRTGRLR